MAARTTEACAQTKLIDTSAAEVTNEIIGATASSPNRWVAVWRTRIAAKTEVVSKPNTSEALVTLVVVSRERVTAVSKKTS
jgi:hypothetical protein